MREPRRIRVDFPGDIADALINVALDEHRRPADQTVVFVRDALREQGKLPADVPRIPPSVDTDEPTVGVYIKLRGEVAAALRRVADEQGRNPRVQAALYIEDALRRSGDLAIDVPYSSVGANGAGGPG